MQVKLILSFVDQNGSYCSATLGFASCDLASPRSTLYQKKYKILLNSADIFFQTLKPKTFVFILWKASVASLLFIIVTLDGRIHQEIKF